MSTSPRFGYAQPSRTRKLPLEEAAVEARRSGGDLHAWLRRELAALRDDPARAQFLGELAPERIDAARAPLLGIVGAERAQAIFREAFSGRIPLHAPSLPRLGDSEEGGLSAAHVAASSSQGEPLAPKLRERAEKALSVDLQGVEVHRDAAAHAATASLGARAFAVEGHIYLGKGEQAEGGKVVAHELAHVAQQRRSLNHAGRGKGPWKRGGRGNSVEREADRAARAIVGGGRAMVGAAEAARVQYFEGAEHVEIGDRGFGDLARKEGSIEPEGEPDAPGMLTVGDVTASPGIFTALQGDFYGDSWEKLEKDCFENGRQVETVIERLIGERIARSSHHGNPASFPEPVTDGPNFVAAFGTSADYLGEAKKNYNHFSERTPEAAAQFQDLKKKYPSYAAELQLAEKHFGANVALYLTQHFQSIERAASAAHQTSKSANSAYQVAIAMDAAGCHYLSDAFASGHIRTPRHGIKQAYVADAVRRAQEDAPEEARALAIAQFEGGLENPALAKLMLPTVKQKLEGIYCKKAEDRADIIAMLLHEKDNNEGVNVTNLSGAKWKAYGDHHLSSTEGDDPKMAGDKKTNRAMVYAAVRLSAMHLSRVHDLVSSGAGQHGAPQPNSQATLPYVSLLDILNLIPIPTSDNPVQEEWRPGKISSELASRANGATMAIIQKNAGPLVGEASMEASQWTGQNVVDPVGSGAAGLVKQARARIIGLGQGLIGGGAATLRSAQAAEAEFASGFERSIRALYGAP